LTREGNWNKDGGKRNRVEGAVQTSCLVLRARGETMDLSGNEKPPFGKKDFSEWRLFLLQRPVTE
jgi:hypothetical protein